MTNYVHQIEAAIHALHIEEDGACTWYGKQVLGETEANRRSWKESEQARSALISDVSNVLYEYFYVTGGPVNSSSSVGFGSSSREEEFVRRLQLSVASSGSWESDWRLVRVVGENVIVEKNGLRFRARESQIRTGVSTADQHLVEVNTPNVRLYASPGFVLFLGAANSELLPEKGLVRFYWHITEHCAASFISLVTTSLNEMRIPFSAKALTHTPYRRCDAGVVYMGLEHCAFAFDALRGIYDSLQTHIRPMVPAFTRRLAPGFGAAIDPGDGSSFGQSRCRIVAVGFVNAAAVRVHDSRDVMQFIDAAFRSAGLDLRRPYLSQRGDELSFATW